MSRSARSFVALAVLVLGAPLAAVPAGAQSTTSSIQGTVSDDTGVLPGAIVVAKDTQNGFTYEATTDAQGYFALSGMRPGTYDITVTMDQFKPQARTVQLTLGQEVTLNFRITPDVVYAEQVTVVGSANRLVETRTNEISTVVSEEQVRYLPQNQRNFLNFANLAPGVKVSQDETNQQVTAGGLGATAINVFIDGVSYKNDVLEGGVVGQDSSRGSPFPQTAVQEFQVLTQNYKAEHEKASSAVITAVTKSGTNRWSGDGFLFYQNKDLVSLDKYTEERKDQDPETFKKPTYERWQPGISIGGPIVKDRLFVFGAYEENRQDRDAQVFFGAPPPPGLNLSSYQGTFPSEFREKLPFLKGTWQPGVGQIVDLSYSLRTESDVRSFGNQTSFEAAEDVKNRVDSVLGRWNLPGSTWLNEATVTYQRFEWNPEPLNPNVIGQEYQGILRVGGRDTIQEFVQTRTSIRDDMTHYAKWNGNHTMKGGVVLSFLKYDATKYFNGNPLFLYRSDTNWSYPSEARYGFGDPNQTADNTQFGFFVQDDWTVGSRLTLNVGLRWDYESNMLNNDYVTPADVVDWARTNFNVPDRYVTDGDQRPPFKKAWAPRLGVSYDLTGEGRHILFGGYGRYWDRNIFNYGFDEKFRLQYQVLTYRFSLDGQPDPNGNPTIAWRPEYLSKAALDALASSPIRPKPEVFLIDNDTEPPVSDQFNAGFRTSVKGILLTANYAGVRGNNGFTFIFGNRNPDGGCCRQVPGPFSNLLLSTDTKKSWYDALYLTADRPFDGKWGMQVAYTLGQAEAIGGDLFSLDYLTPADYPHHPTPDDERNRLVAAGILGLPYDFLVSGNLILSSGLGFTIYDASQGYAFGDFKVRLYEGRPDHDLAYRTLDLRLEKIFRLGATQRVSAAVEAFNIFDYTNDNRNCTSGDIFQPPAVNQNFGRATCVVDNSSRRFQFGLRYTF